ncbi:hypothetical protein OTU49_011803 [Cherax quadricarinatus]|uniref:Uncharacterized protein n=1 Tax=Cherax quadricarinatus TaxID=27406 RepID=A0AAW0W235_CHEQU
MNMNTICMGTLYECEQKYENENRMNVNCSACFTHRHSHRSITAEKWDQELRLDAMLRKFGEHLAGECRCWEVSHQSIFVLQDDPGNRSCPTLFKSTPTISYSPDDI